jgi:hypothetical protein
LTVGAAARAAGCPGICVQPAAKRTTAAQAVHKPLYITLMLHLPTPPDARRTARPPLRRLFIIGRKKQQEEGIAGIQGIQGIAKEG